MLSRQAHKKSKKIKETKKNRVFKFKRILIALAVLVGIVLIGYLIILFGGALVVDERALKLDYATTIETVDGDVIKELYEEHRHPIDMKQIPDEVKTAFVAIEDRRFYEHNGIDMKSIGRAIYRDILMWNKAEGASTITQQTAKNLFLSSDKTWMRKIKEMMAALYLERNFTKDEILELYLNAIYFGNGAHGLETAANSYFSKSANELSISEAAMLAGLVKAPSSYSPVVNPDKALNRRNIVLDAMQDYGSISAETKLTAADEGLNLQLPEAKNRPWLDSYIDLVMKEAAKKHELSIEDLKRGGYRIVVEIDDGMQASAYKEFQDNAYFPGSTDDAEGAFVMLDKANGAVKVAIGGRKYQLGDLNRVTVKRQPGSVFKPIAVYGPAMMQKYKPYSLIIDQEKKYDDYVATNYDGKYDQSVTIYDAIMESKNASAVWLLNQIGIPYAKTYLEKLDLEIPDDGLAIALGGLSEGVTPLEIAAAYQPFANNGKFTETFSISKIYDVESKLIFTAKPKFKEVFRPQVAWDMTEMLIQTVRAGTAKPGYYAGALAGKTGSTQHPFVEGKTKDAWFVGYTPEYIGAIWMGYDQSDQTHYLTGDSGFPTKLMKDILTHISRENRMSTNFTRPKDVKDLPQPIKLPEINAIEGSYVFGGASMIKGIISWSITDIDDRVIYRIYKVRKGLDKRIGETKGVTEFIIDHVPLLETPYYYVVPYNPLTKMEGKRSGIVEISI